MKPWKGNIAEPSSKWLTDGVCVVKASSVAKSFGKPPRDPTRSIPEASIAGTVAKVTRCAKPAMVIESVQCMENQVVAHANGIAAVFCGWYFAMLRRVFGSKITMEIARAPVIYDTTKADGAALVVRKFGEVVAILTSRKPEGTP